jgi:hypothetical protein
VVELSNGSFTGQGYQTFNASGGIAANWSATTTNNITDIGNPSNPHYMIVGPNASFSGNGGTNFNPYFQSTATTAFKSVPAQGNAVEFDLSAAGVTGSSIISHVVFNFGTSPSEHTLNGTGVTVLSTPAPSSALLVGLGGVFLIGFAGLARRRRATTATTTA